MKTWLGTCFLCGCVRNLQVKVCKESCLKSYNKLSLFKQNEVWEHNQKEWKEVQDE